MSDALLVSFLSFCTGSSDLFRADGELRKRTLTILADRLPALAVPVDAVGGVPRVRLLVRALRAIGALASDGAPVPVVEGWRILATYGTAGRLSLYMFADTWVGLLLEENVNAQQVRTVIQQFLDRVAELMGETHASDS